MKLQLDTKAKTIKVESNILIKDLIKTLKKLFPNKEYENFVLQTNVTIQHWSNPIIIQEEETSPYPQYPWAIWNGTNMSSELKIGVYNVEC